MKSREKRFMAWLRDPAADVWLFIIAVVLLNLVAVRAFVRWDITGPKSYSLSEGSRQAVRTLEEPLGVKVFFTSNLPAQYNNVYQYLRDLLAEYQTASGGRLGVEYCDMDKPENQSMARSYGVSQVQIREIKNNEMGYKNAFMGMAFTYADQIEVLDVTSSSGLEYRITTTIGGIVAAANELSSLRGNIAVTLYKSGNLAPLRISGYDGLDGAVADAVAALNKKYRGRLELRTEDPPSADIAALQERYGVPALTLGGRDGQVQYGTLALVLENGGSSRCLPFPLGQALDLSRGAIVYEVQGADTLEADIDASIQSLAANVTTVAYITGHGELSSTDGQEGAGNFAALFKDRYEFADVNLAEADIPVGVRTALVNGPRTAFSEAELYKLDQFLMRGGSLMLFLDPFDVVEPQGQAAYYSQPEYVPVQTGLERLLSKYGITCDAAYVYDEECFTQANQQFGRLSYYYVPQVPLRGMNQRHPVSKNLGYVLFLQPGPVDVSAAQKDGDVQVSVLASSSPRSWTRSDGIMLDPRIPATAPEGEELRAHGLAALVEGRFRSAFDAAPAAAAESPLAADEVEGAAVEEPDGGVETSRHLARSTQPGRIFVAATSFITTAQLLSEEDTDQQPVALLLENAVDYLNGNGELCTMRTKGMNLNALNARSGPLVQAATYFNEVGLAVLVAVAGLAVLFLRRQHRAAIRLRYSPGDSREQLGNKKSTQKEAKHE